MWSVLSQFFNRLRGRRETVSPPSVDTRLPAQTREEAVQEARKLFAQGVWVRDVRVGETPSDMPEIEDIPLDIPLDRSKYH